MKGLGDRAYHNRIVLINSSSGRHPSADLSSFYLDGHVLWFRGLHTYDVLYDLPTLKLQKILQDTWSPSSLPQSRM